MYTNKIFDVIIYADDKTLSITDYIPQTHQIKLLHDFGALLWSFYLKKTYLK